MLKKLNLVQLRNLLSLAAMFAIGWFCKGVYVDIQELTCADYSTKHAIWSGFSASKNGEVRCFWLENTYPWRTRQGVAQ